MIWWILSGVSLVGLAIVIYSSLVVAKRSDELIEKMFEIKGENNE